MYTFCVMRVARLIFVMLLVAGLTVYAFDCSAASTPDEAMQCCDSMPCHHSHNGSQDCCENMQSSHLPFMQPHSLDTASHASTFHAMLPAADAVPRLDCFAQILLGVNSHAPPGMPTAAVTPLRI
jgi:hypothetical protein